jgi:hypothetical protein
MSFLGGGAIVKDVVNRMYRVVFRHCEDIAWEMIKPVVLRHFVGDSSIGTVSSSEFRRGGVP